MEYKVGDTVLIREREYFIQEYGSFDNHPCGWRPDKDDFCGKEVVIVEVFPGVNYVRVAHQDRYVRRSVHFLYKDILPVKSIITEPEKKFKIIKKQIQEI